MSNLKLVKNEFLGIQESISREVNRRRLVELEPSEIGMELFLEVAKAYYKEKGYLPESWATYMDNRIRYIRILVAHGEEIGDLKSLDLIELRDMCNEYEYIETATVMPNGGVSVMRRKMSGNKAA